MGLKVTNNAFGTLNAGISSGDTVIVLEAGQGARFPVLSAGDYFYATLIDTSNQLEIVKVTARATDTMTVVRAQDGTSSRAYNVNDRFELRPTAALFNEKANDDEVVKKAGDTMTGDLTVASAGTRKVSVNRTNAATAGAIEMISGDSQNALSSTGAKDIGVEINGTEIVRFKSGGGIQFPSTQLASANANTLDDYEEGSFTASIGGRTFAASLCNYVKVGRVCFVVISLESLNSAISGNIIINGLPFVGDAIFSGSHAANSVPFCEVGGVSFASSVGAGPAPFLMYGRVQNGTPNLQLLQTNGRFHDAFTAGGGLGTGATLRTSFSYTTSA